MPDIMNTCEIDRFLHESYEDYDDIDGGITSQFSDEK